MRVLYRVPAPVPSQDGEPTWTQAEIYRAPDSAGSPGAWSLVTTVTLLTNQSFTPYEDTGATGVTNWYRHRYLDALSVPDDYSTEIQVREFEALALLMADIPDADVISMWDTWRREAILGLWTAGGVGVSLPDTQTITPVVTDATISTEPDEYYDLQTEIEEVVRIESVGFTNLRHYTWLYVDDEWTVEGRRVRLFQVPDVSSFKYVVHGRRRYRSVSEIPESLFMLYYWLARKAYLQFRQNQKANFLEYVTFGSRRTNISPEQMDLFLRRCDFEIAAILSVVQDPDTGREVPIGQPD